MEAPPGNLVACALRAGTLECSVVILTLNEERNIGACLDSLAGFDDIHVLDSGSSDATTALALERGAKVSVNPFRSFGQQRNWAHERMPLRHAWVLHLDADERMTISLQAEIAQAIAADTGAVGGYFIAERTLLEGRWLRHAGQYPRYQARLVHRQRMSFVDHGHGQREQSDLPFERLSQPYDHHAFSHGIEHWLKKHAGYAMREAEVAAGLEEPLLPLLRRALGGSALERRRALKALSQQLPMRPQLRWLYVMIVRAGALDGRAGWTYAKMMSVFQHMIDLSAQELASSQRAAPRAAASPMTSVPKAPKP